MVLEVIISGLFGVAGENATDLGKSLFRTQSFRNSVIKGLQGHLNLNKLKKPAIETLLRDDEFWRYLADPSTAETGTGLEHRLQQAGVDDVAAAETFRGALENAVVSAVFESGSIEEKFLVLHTVQQTEALYYLLDLVVTLSDQITQAQQSTQNAPVVYPQFVGVPSARAPLFGRVEVQNQLTQMLTSSGSGSVAITGMGGIGKSAVAAELCYDARDEYHGVRWIDASSHETLVAKIRSMAAAIGVAIDGLDEEDVFSRVRSELENPGRSWLLVFDDAVDSEVLKEILPLGGNVSVVITSRHDDWTGYGIEAVPLGVLHPDPAVELLASRSGRIDDPYAYELAERLGYLSLALDQAAVYCRKLRCSFEGYLRMVDPQPERAIKAVLKASIDQAVTESPEARQVLELLSYYGPNGIPTSVLLGEQVEQAPEGRTEELPDKVRILEAIAELESFSLITVRRANETGEPTVSLHPLIQETSRAAKADEGEWGWLYSAVELLSNDYPADPEMSESWLRRSALEPHVLAITQHCQDVPNLPQAVADMVSELELRHAAMTLYHGFPINSIPLFEAAARRIEARSGPDSAATLRAKLALAKSYRSEWQFADSIRTLNEVIPKMAETPGIEPVEVLIAQAKLGWTYQGAGQIVTALEILEVVVPQIVEALPDKHRDALAAEAELGWSLRSAGRLDEAIEIFERVIPLSTEVLGPFHFHTLTRRGDLAACLYSAGRFEEAVRRWESITADSDEALKPGHPRSLTRWVDLARGYNALGRHSEALVHLRRVIPQLEDRSGVDHPRVLVSRLVLARSLYQDGQLVAAVAELEEIIPKLEASLTAEHYRYSEGWELLDLSFRDVLSEAIAIAGTSEPEQVSEALNVRGVSSSEDDVRDIRATWAALESDLDAVLRLFETSPTTQYSIPRQLLFDSLATALHVAEATRPDLSTIANGPSMLRLADEASRQTDAEILPTPRQTDAENAAYSETTYSKNTARCRTTKGCAGGSSQPPRSLGARSFAKP